jgi:septal ring factor EnvC (AmiA/AmiB activator)
MLSVTIHAASTTAKIKHSKQDLSATVSQKKKASRQLEKIASDIKKAEKDIAYLEKKIAELGRNQEKNEAKLTALKKALKRSKQAYSETTRQLDAKQKVFFSLLADQFSVVYALQQFKTPTKDAILSYEVYEAYKRYNTKMLREMKQEIETLRKKQESKRYLQHKTEKEIERIVKRKEEYAKKKLAKKRLLEKLAKDEERYTAKLEKLEDRQNDLRATLAKLNILQQKEVEEERRRAAARKEAMRLEKERKRKLRLAKARAREKARQAKAALRRAKNEAERARARKAVKEAQKEATVVYKESDKVRKINSSYKKPSIAVYKGGKTISPIDGARVVKRFGTYVDPIYKIKIFNESVTLKAPVPDAKVKNVLNGKVVFAGQTSMLGKVVVVAHAHKLHTVYAGLSKIAPTVKVGSKLRQGYVVGKVKSKLLFQATKNSKHINPLKLIRI